MKMQLENNFIFLKLASWKKGSSAFLRPFELGLKDSVSFCVRVFKAEWLTFCPWEADS